MPRSRPHDGPIFSIDASDHHPIRVRLKHDDLLRSSQSACSQENRWVPAIIRDRKLLLLENLFHLRPSNQAHAMFLKPRAGFFFSLCILDTNIDGFLIHGPNHDASPG